MIAKRAFTMSLLMLMSTNAVLAQQAAPTGNNVNSANNPLTPEVTLNLQDYYVPEASDVRGSSNQFLFRGLVPENIGGLPQLLRFTVPIATGPLIDGTETAVGDVTFTDFFVMPGKVTFAAGPLLVVPSPTAFSQGSWQTGAAGVAISPQSWGILGGLVIYQHSFAEALQGADVSTLTFQPVITYNLPHNFYLRSSGIWTFDLVHHVSYVPIGLGIGQVVKLGKTTMNYFIEPQYSVARNGTGAPVWQIFGGINFQFATH